MSSGVTKIAVLDAPLQPDPLDPSQVLEGEPVTSDHAVSVSADGRSVSGVWSCSPGTFSDVEVDETFVVLSGRATIEHAGESHEVGPGDVCVLPAGAETTWTIHEDLTKVFVVVET